MYIYQKQPLGADYQATSDNKTLLGLRHTDFWTLAVCFLLVLFFAQKFYLQPSRSLLAQAFTFWALPARLQRRVTRLLSEIIQMMTMTATKKG